MAVIFGGDKAADGSVVNRTSNPRSWKSYETVSEDIGDALRRIGVGHVELIPDDMRLGERLQRNDIHLAWINSGGVQGYNAMSHAPAILEMLGVPYVGHDPLNAGTLDNKHAFKRDLTCLGLPTAPFMTWHLARGPFRPTVNSRFIQFFKDHWGAFVVKPVSGRASLHVHFVENEADLTEAVAEVYRATQNHVLIEAYLPGREFCVAVCGPIFARDRQLYERSDPFIFSTMERLLESDERIATSMDVQPITNERIRLLDPDQDIAELDELRELARKVFLDFNLEHVVRLDVRVDPAGKMKILEANPKPDLKRPTQSVTSIVCAGLPAYGMDYEDMILSFLASRLDFLFHHRRQAIPQLVRLLQ